MDQGGIRLADFLAASFPEADRVRLRRAVLDGLVGVNGMQATPGSRLRAGDQVQCQIDPATVARRTAPPPGLPAVVFENEHLLVIDKPASVPTVPDRAGQGGIHGLLPELRPGADLRIAHRLDRDTSGLLLLAKGIEAARFLDAAFRSGAVEKEYLALVHGVPVADAWTIDLFLGPDPRRPGKVVAAESARKGFRAARTEAAVERRFEGFTLLRLRPRTGRGHQLRVHLSTQGLPIVGDGDYGGEPLLLSRLKRYKRRQGVAERPVLERMFLHAARLRLRDPAGADLDLEAPLPADLRLCLDKLERFGAGRE